MNMCHPTVRRLLQRVVNRSGASRRGTILILALGVLGILSVAALSYVTIVRLDRRSAIVASRPENFRQQVNAALEHIRALLAADLFGNKIVTASVPISAWPGAFEDGETWDYPSTMTVPNNNRYTFNENDPDVDPSPNAILSEINLPASPQPVRRTFETGFPGDAWLASIDPYVQFDVSGRYLVNENNIEVWPQVSNLRSAYTWDAQDERWVRGDGRFVDLAQWFLAFPNNSGFAQPGVDLRNWGDLDLGASSNPGKLDARDGVNQAVFNLQMNMVGEDDPTLLTSEMFIAPGGLDNEDNLRFDGGDERRWVDTVGDGRPDARWTTLESMGNLFGLNWVVAARIIDASALINLNTAIELAADNAQFVGTGQTPADVDLYRLLSEANIFGGSIANSPYAGDVFVDRLDNSFQTHLIDAIPTQVILNVAGDLETSDFNINLGYSQFQRAANYDFASKMFSRGGTSRLERFAHFHLFGSSNRRPLSFAAEHLPERDLIDLMASWGTNYGAIVTRSEQRFDADPPLIGYLPDGTDTLEYGPFRARELPQDIRKFNRNLLSRAPNNRQLLENNIRRLVTTVSGEGPFSPVPVVNDAALLTFGGQRRDAFAGIYRREKIRLDDPLTDEETQRAFESFVWALAPLATDRALFAPTDGGPPDLNVHFNLANSSFHYGGGTGGPAGTPGNPGLRTARNLLPGQTASSAFRSFRPDFALFTAASLAVNLRDAVDRDNVPTVAQFFFTPVPNPTSNDERITGTIEFNTRFAQGDLNNITLGAGSASRLVQDENITGGNASDDLRDGVTFIGLERQPFITEVATFAFYTDYTGGIDELGNLNGIMGDIPAEKIGSAILVELSNPWSTSIQIDRHFIEIVKGSNAGAVRLGQPGNIRLRLGIVTIPAGDSKAFLFVAPGSTATGIEITDELRFRLNAAGASREVGNPANPMIVDPNTPIIFEDLANNVGPNPVVLLTTSSAGDLLPIDRLTPNSMAPFPAAGQFDIRLGASDSADNVPGPIDLAYFGALGYDPADPRLNSPTGRTGRAMIVSSIGRGKDVATTNGTGFPAYVLESPAKNEARVRRAVHAWLEPPGADPVGTLSRDDPNHLVRDAGQPFPVFLRDYVAGVVSGPGGFHDGRWAGQIAPFQLFVPAPDFPKQVPHVRSDTQAAQPIRFSSLAELHMLSSYAHFYQSNSLFSLLEESQGQKFPSGAALVDDDRTNLNLLTTVSEWLGQSTRYDFTNPASAANPYLGVLDPTRFILTSQAGPPSDLAPVADLPNHLAVPLALRVFECFDALPVSDEDTAIQGRVNINTAPNRVLQMLPFIDPPNVFAMTTDLPPNSSIRLLLIEAYRRSEEPQGFNFGPFFLTGMAPLRGGPSPVNDQTTAFVSVGELAILDQWAGDGLSAPRTIAPGSTGFLQLGANQVATTGNPFDPLDPQPFELVTDYAVGKPYNPTDDPEERLALFRALSNIVTTRSDVFIAWFVIRGYDPEVIEQVNIGPGGNTSDALEKMEDPTVNFGPAYESRWLAILDRSNVRRPTDRPEIRMIIELPRVAFSPQPAN